MLEEIRRQAEFIACAVAALLIFAAGWAVEGWRKEVEIERLKADQQTAIAKAEAAAVQRLAAAEARGNALSKRLTEEEAARDQLTQEKDHEIRRLTVGRRCLDGAAVRLLNQPAGQSAPVPPYAGEPVRADAAFATDTDVGIWIGQCRRAYDTCRGRLQAVADFEAGEKDQ